MDAVQIHGDRSNPVNLIAIKAIADLEEFWDAQFPKLYSHNFQPVKRGFYGVIPSAGGSLPCGETVDEVADNAFYNRKCDNIAWDAEKLLPDLRKDFGDFAVAVVLAHEWGHAIQQRAKFDGPPVIVELQADCFAGAWAKHASKDDALFKPTSHDLDNALAGFVLKLRDEPGQDPDDPHRDPHGSGFDRVSSFRTGFDKGAAACREYRDGDPTVTELPWNDEADEASGGDAPFEDIINGVPAELEDYWSQVYPDVAGKPWTPLQPPRAFDPSDPPSCGGKPVTDSAVFYCSPPEDYVGFDTVKEMPELYQQGGDFAVATLIAYEYGLAALIRDGQDPDAKRTSLRAHCLAGGWAASIFNQANPDSRFKMSPGDLDKAIVALLVWDGWDVKTQGTGSARVDAYRDGVLKGTEVCINR